jgi:stage V sporulation protein S
MDVLKVSSKSVPSSVAGAMAGVVRQHGAVEVQVVGAGALNQAIKAVAIARGYLAPSGIDVVCVPTFVDVQIDGESRTALRLSIEDRTGVHGSAPPRTIVDLRETTPAEADGDGSKAPLSLEA